MEEKRSKTTSSKRTSSERKPKSELESKIFRDGAIYIFKRADYVKPRWFCRIKIPVAKGYISKSTKTTDEHLAFKFTDDLHLKGLAEVASGRDINSKKSSTPSKNTQRAIQKRKRKSPRRPQERNS